MLKKVLCAIGLSTLLYVSPVAATTSPYVVDTDNYLSVLQSIAKQEGCEADIHIQQSDSDGGNGHYISADVVEMFGYDKPVIIIEVSNDWTYDMNIYVGLHEIGHCLQDKAGWIRTYGSPYVEWDADIRAQQLAEKYGFDPEAGAARIRWRAAHGQTGDYAHGSIIARLVNTVRYMSARIQSP
jgi:hypothetical protein